MPGPGRRGTTAPTATYTTKKKLISRRRSLNIALLLSIPIPIRHRRNLDHNLLAPLPLLNGYLAGPPPYFSIGGFWFSYQFTGPVCNGSLLFVIYFTKIAPSETISPKAQICDEILPIWGKYDFSSLWRYHHGRYSGDYLRFYAIAYYNAG